MIIKWSLTWRSADVEASLRLVNTILKLLKQVFKCKKYILIKIPKK